MKYLLHVLLLSFFLACGSGDPSGENKKGEDLLFALDTLQIDAKGEILYLNSDLSYAVLDKDKKYLYNMNRKNFSIEQIDLDMLELSSVLRFEKEGPDGIGPYMDGIKWMEGDRFLMSGYGKLGLFDSNGKKLAAVGPEVVPSFASEEVGGNVLHAVRMPGNTSTYAGIYLSSGSREPKVLLWDTERKSYQKLANPLNEKSKQYQTEFDDGTTAFFLGGLEHLEVVNETVLLEIGGSSDLYILDPEAKDFRKKTFENGWIPREKETVFPDKINNRALFTELLKKSTEEIFYHSPIWDESRQVYLRLSHELEYGEEAGNPSDRLFPEPSGARVYLTVYDADFIMLRESRVPVLDKAPSQHFVKDGKIWIFENIDDEMAFVRLTFDL